MVAFPRFISRARSVEFLVQRGADVNIQTNAGATALHEAASHGDERCVKILLENQANVHLQTDLGETALHWAAGYGTPKMVSSLLSSGADATARTKAGETPGLWANRNMRPDLVKELLPAVEETFPVSENKQFASGSIWGVLIGIDSYSGGTDSDSATDGGKSHQFSNLRGCVNDALLVERYLRDFRGVPPDHIKKLVTGCQDDGSLAPTSRNIVDAIESTADAATPGDSVYIHYSGHGGESATHYPSLKGRRRVDSLLITQDFQTVGGCLRDIELDYLLRKMVRKGLAVTLVLDCRLEGFMRSFPISKDRQWTLELADYQSHGPMFDKTLGFFEEEIHNHGVNPFSGQGGYTLFVTSMAVELNEGRRHHGLLTYCLVDLLQDVSLESSSCQGIYKRLRVQMLKRDRRAKVSLLGDADRSFHGIGNTNEMEAALTSSAMTDFRN